MMKQVAPMLLILVLSPMCLAVPTKIKTDGLTDEQIAKLSLQAAQMANEVEMVEKVGRWVEVGEAIGEGLASAAGKLGMQVNDFAMTPVGKFAIFIIAYKIIGTDIIRILVAATLFVLFFFMWTHFYRRMCVVKGVFYHESGKKQKIEYYNTSDRSDSLHLTRFLMWLGFFVMIVICVLCAFLPGSAF